MRKRILGFGTIILLILTGCTEPSFDINNRHIQFIGGKPFYIPYYAHYFLSTMSEKSAANFRAAGILHCKEGDVFWSITKDPYQVPQLYKEGKANCEHPLSQEEYSYRLNQQNQAAAASNVMYQQDQANLQAVNSQLNYNNQQTLNRLNYNHQQMYNRTL